MADILPKSLPGGRMLADSTAIFGAMDVVFREVDR
jgi:NADH:ubiquinone oxidoreductase subunit D